MEHPAVKLNFRDRSKVRGRIIRNLWPFFLAAVVLLAVIVARSHPWPVEYIYSRRIYPVIASVISFFSRFFSFSLWDLFWVIIIWLGLSCLILLFLKRIRPGFFLLRVLQLTALMFSGFYILWGFNYFRPAIEIRTSWPAVKADEISFYRVLDSVAANASRNFVQDRMIDLGR